ncbi:MAG: LPXTG cell wall anchor domain-containing protein [Brevibacterium aurantiacum]|uniref:LPXTG cell wall anchor domain-containing protein n=2 Tax=Brevibacterium aurantiacum TaxID=273384 RepID=UPI0018696AF8|nr:HtaA domain-containing protein [Brevibacterium aurantiacum]
MSHRSVHASAKKARRITPTLATGAACAAVTGLLGLGMSAPAAAADKTVEDAVFDWSVNDESTGGSYFGGCNFLVAGEAGDAGSARIWNRDDADNVYPTDAEGNFVDGNTSIVKTNGKKSTFDTKCRTGDGVSVNGKINAQAENNHTGDRVEIKNGTGTIDPDGDNASIQWDGSWSFAYYGGMTYWTISDPKLEVKDGKGTITGTYSGYGADMDDPSIWLKLKPREGEVVEIQNGEVDVTDEGFEFTPDYLGVKTETEGRNPQAPKSAENESWWGAMPQDWIDFNVETGQDSYWFTSAGPATSIQPRKTTNPVTVEYTAQAPAPDVSTSHSVKSASAEDGLTVNVKGEGYDNLPNSSLGTPAAGVYAAVVDRELASDDITAGNTAGVQYVRPTQINDGKVDVDVVAETDALSEDYDYDLVTWVAHGLAQGDALLYRESIELTNEQKQALFPGEDTDEAAAESDAEGNGAGAEASVESDGTADGPEAEAETDGAADGSEAEAETDGAADSAEADDTSAADGAESDDKGSADSAGAADGSEAAAAADGAAAGAESETDGAADGSEAEAETDGAADSAEADDTSAADGAESDDKGSADSAGAADGSEAAAAADGAAADGAEAESDSAADGDDSDGSDDGADDKPQTPQIGDQTVGENGEIKGTTTPNAEVTLSWAPAGSTPQSATHVKVFKDEVPSTGTASVTADDEGNFTAKAPSEAGTYAYSAVTTVEGVPSDPAQFTVTVNPSADDGSAGSSDGAVNAADGAVDGTEGAADGTEAAEEGSADGGAGTADGGADSAESTSDGAGETAGAGAEGSSSSDSGNSAGSNLPRTGAELATLPIAAGLIVLGAASVVFSRMRKR